MPLFKSSLRNLLAFSLCPVLLTACAYNLISPSPKVFEDTNPDRLKGFNDALAKAKGTATEKDATAKATTAEEKPGPKEFKNLLKEGAALVEYNCTLYFDRLGKAQQEIGFTRKETSLAGGVVSGALGLAHATTKTVANTAAAFGFTTSSMDAYQDSYLYSPDVGAVQTMVAARMDIFKKDNITTQLDDQKSPTYTGVVSLLTQYEAICQPHGIRALINKAVADKPAADKAAAGNK